MELYHIIKFPERVTSRYFYTDLLPEVNKYLDNRNINRKKLYFDLGSVEVINSLTIPNLLILGHQIRILCNHSAKMYIPTKSYLLSYLDEINFLNYIRRFSIFELLEDYIGDYDTNNSDSRKTYYIGNSYTPEMIWNALNISNTVIERAYTNKFCTSDINDAVGIKLSLWEICKNSVLHANSFAFLTIQRQKNLGKVMIAQADTGNGIYESLKRRILLTPYKEQLHFLKNDTFLQMENNDDKELYAIIEAAFYRKIDKNNNRGIYGIWNVIYETTKRDEGIVRIDRKSVV